MRKDQKHLKPNSNIVSLQKHHNYPRAVPGDFSSEPHPSSHGASALCPADEMGGPFRFPVKQAQDTLKQTETNVTTRGSFGTSGCVQTQWNAQWLASSCLPFPNTLSPSKPSQKSERRVHVTCNYSFALPPTNMATESGLPQK